MNCFLNVECCDASDSSQSPFQFDEKETVKKCLADITLKIEAAIEGFDEECAIYEKDSKRTWENFYTWDYRVKPDDPIILIGETLTRLREQESDLLKRLADLEGE